MSHCKQLAARALLLALVLAPPAGAAVWRSYNDPMTGSWDMDVLPSGVGYAGRAGARSDIVDVRRTQDGGKTWRSVMKPPKGDYGQYWTLANGNAVVTYLERVNTLVSQPQVGHLTAATNKTAQLAVEVPKGLTVSYKSFRSVAPVPGQSKAFALVGCTDGRTPSQMHGVLYWSGGTAWKFIKVTYEIQNLVAASPTAAWATSSGNVLRWDGKAWVQQRKGAAGERVELLKAVPPVGSSPAAVWAKLTKTTNGIDAETLLLCDTTRCTAKKTAGTTGKYPGRFLTPDYPTFNPGGFDAASTKLALVWEVLPSNNPNKTTVALQQFNGAKWTTAMKVSRQSSLEGSDVLEEPMYIHSPEVRVSIASGSPTRAVAVLAHTLPYARKTGTLVSHTWNGAKWTPQANATFTKGLHPQIATLDRVQKLQALSTGNALLTLYGSMWRLI